MRRRMAMLAAVIAVTSGSALAADVKYVIDPNHTYPSFEFPHMGISVWRGKFAKTSGTITIDRAAGTGTADIVVDTASIDFGLGAMDKEARSENFFNVAKFPAATYRGTLKFTADTPTAVEGELTLLGVTRPVKLTINLFKCMPHPMLKKEVCGADAEGELNWAEFGMKNSKFGAGDAGRVHLRIQVEGLRQD